MPKSNGRDLSWAGLPASQGEPWASLETERIPMRPGVYVLYRSGNPVYIGKSVNLRASLAQALAERGPSAVSPLRRSAAEYLGLTSAREIQKGLYRPTSEDHEHISGWVRGCSVAWRECASEADVVELDAKLHAGRQLEASGEGDGAKV